MLRNDLKRNRMVTVTLFVCIVFATMLASGAVNIILTLFGSMDALIGYSIGTVIGTAFFASGGVPTAARKE